LGIRPFPCGEERQMETLVIGIGLKNINVNVMHNGTGGVLLHCKEEESAVGSLLINGHKVFCPSIETIRKAMGIEDNYRPGFLQEVLDEIAESVYLLTDAFLPWGPVYAYAGCWMVATEEGWKVTPDNVEKNIGLVQKLEYTIK
jgi:hypothetical protein